MSGTVKMVDQVTVVTTTEGEYSIQIISITITIHFHTSIKYAKSHKNANRVYNYI